MVSPLGQRLARPIPQKELLANACHLQDTAFASASDPMSVYTDCSGTQGASGAPLLSSIDGVSKIRAKNVGGGGPDKDGMPYSFEAGSSEMAVNLDPEIVQQLAAFEAK
jgi:hypothetical protein